MADFLGSYYDSSEMDGSELDEKVMSQRIAILNAEQPVSVLDMEKVASRSIPSRLRGLDKLREGTAVEKQDSADRFSTHENNSSDEDLEIPVASMSLFDQEKPSMVSVQLQSLSSPNFRGPIPPAARSPFSPSKRPDRESRDPASSPASVGHPRERSADPSIPFRRESRLRKVAHATGSSEPQLGAMERRTSTVKASILKLFGRKQDQKGKGR